MSPDNIKTRFNIRPLAIIVLAVLFIGMIAISVIKIKHNAGGVSLTEAQLNQYWVAEGMARDKSGALIITDDSLLADLTMSPQDKNKTGDKGQTPAKSKPKCLT